MRTNTCSELENTANTVVTATFTAKVVQWNHRAKCGEPGPARRSLSSFVQASRCMLLLTKKLSQNTKKPEYSQQARWELFQKSPRKVRLLCVRDPPGNPLLTHPHWPTGHTLWYDALMQRPQDTRLSRESGKEYLSQKLSAAQNKNGLSSRSRQSTHSGPTPPFPKLSQISTKNWTLQKSMFWDTSRFNKQFYFCETVHTNSSHKNKNKNKNKNTRTVWFKSSCLVV